MLNTSRTQKSLPQNEAGVQYKREKKKSCQRTKVVPT